MMGVERAQRILERKDPAYRAWREEKEGKVRLWQQQWLRGGMMRSADVRSCRQECHKLVRRLWEGGLVLSRHSAGGAAWCAPSGCGRRQGCAEQCWEKPHQFASRLVGSLLPGHGTYCTWEEACRLKSARTDDRSFVALLNEAMAVALPGEPIPRAEVDQVKMLVVAVR